MNRFILTAFFALSVIGLYSQTNIIEDLQVPDSQTNAAITIHQSQSITDVVNEKLEGFEPTSMMSQGWSVQVFSDNSQRGKEQAFRIENRIKERMPHEYVRSERKAPFWKVRVGQFNNIEEARELKEKLIHEFPDLKGGIYVVRFSNN